MVKRILITSTDLMMVQFLLPHVENLYQNGYVVDIACSDVGGRIEELRSKTKGIINKFHLVRTVRNPFSFRNLKGYKDMKSIINENKYDFVWTNEPVMGIVTRLAAVKKRRKDQLKVIYMAHGFHFYKGAPIINWLLFYPIEVFASFFTDMIVTINREDFQRAKKLYAGEVKYIHGIGINTERLSKTNNLDIRKELGLDDDTFLVLSVGELNKNKNQKVIIEALSKIDDEKIHYILCGKGAERNNLEKLATELNVAERVHFLGYRNDVVDICAKADVFAMPTLREGLGLAALEGMYCGLPIVGTSNRGLRDIVVNDKSGFLGDGNDSVFFAESISELKSNREKKEFFGKFGKEISVQYEICNVKQEVLQLFTLL